MNALALDIGLKRIGVALCIDKKVALPLNAIIRKNREQAANEVKALINEHNIALLIVGVPKGASSEAEMTRRIAHFVALLDFAGEVKFVDESFTSKDAQRLGALKWGKKDGKLDSLAALVMMREYFSL